jgi:hypothetical protein
MADFSVLESLLGSTTNAGTPKEKRRFLLVSTHAQQTTGYSKVSHNMVQQLAKCGAIELHHF